MKHFANDHKDRPNHHEISHKLCNEKGNPVLSLTESQWKLRHQESPNGGKAIAEQILASEEIIKSQRAGL